MPEGAAEVSDAGASVSLAVGSAEDGSAGSLVAEGSGATDEAPSSPPARAAAQNSSVAGRTSSIVQAQC